MPNDNQAAKSYIEAVIARADGATVNLTFAIHARQDIPTLAKIALWAIEALEELTEDTPHSREGTIAHDALLEINALAAKGSQ
jgi:hypothetical protein